MVVWKLGQISPVGHNDLKFIMVTMVTELVSLILAFCHYIYTFV